MNTDIIWQILLQIILIALNAIFACAEIAVITMNDTKLAKMAAEGNKKAIRLARLTSKPARFLATIQVAITLSGFLGSAFASQNFAAVIVALVQKTGIGIPESVLNSVAVVLITIILSYITLVFGELVPKQVAMKKAESLALGLSGIISFISTVFAPIVWLLTASTNGILRLMGIDPNAKDDEVTEEEIRMMVDAGSESGTIDDSEKEMIQNVFEFDDITLGSFATHRTDVVFLWDEDTVEVWDETIRRSGHSHFPVCGETADDIIGVISSKDYFRSKATTKEELKQTVMKAPYLVPETLRADVLLKQMKKTGNFFALVLDEYGGFNGIVTVQDIIEQIVGDFPDDGETENSEVKEIEKIGEDKWRIEGTTPLQDVAESLGISLPTDDYDTFGGYVFGLYGSVPDDGSTISVDTDVLHVDVVTINDHRAEVNEVTLKPKTEEDEKDKT